MVAIRTLSLHILLKFVLLFWFPEHEGIPVTQVRASTTTCKCLVSHICHLVAHNIHLLLHHHVFIELICYVTLFLAFFILWLCLHDPIILHSDR